MTKLIFALLILPIFCQSYELNYPRSEQSILYKVNHDLCPEGIIDLHKEWLWKWSQASGLEFIYDGETGSKIYKNDINTVSCASEAHLDSTYGDRVRGVAYSWWDNNVVVESDVMYSAEDYYANSPVIGHEIGHSIGLGHSHEDSIMRANARSKFIKADDLLAVSELYNVDPNCTPQVSHDLDIYVPNYNGMFYELKHFQLDMDPDRFREHLVDFWEVVDSGESQGDSWQCNISIRDGVINFDAQHNMSIINVDMVFQSRFLRLKY